MLRAYDPTPYLEAKTLVNMNSLARILNRLQREGHEIGIISWLSKCGTVEYDVKVIEAKMTWLHKHLKSVQFDFVEIVDYGTDKNLVCTSETDVLFDDEVGNRTNWNGIAYDVDAIIETLKSF